MEDDEQLLDYLEDSLYEEQMFILSPIVVSPVEKLSWYFGGDEVTSPHIGKNLKSGFSIAIDHNTGED